MTTPQTIGEAALAVLKAASPDHKVAAARAAAKGWRDGGLQMDERAVDVPDRPARPALPELKPPGHMPKRSGNGPAGRFAMLHAVAHIEFNAIDLAWDMVARFGPAVARRDFVDDWVRVGDEEARHFAMIRRRLGELSGDYGDLPAHDGLWEAAQDTADDVLARLAIVPLVLEARGLDVSPQMADRFRAAGDTRSAELLDVIYRDEIGHVAAGLRWFERICAKTGQEPVDKFHALVRSRFRGDLKPPFNDAARAQAGLPAAFYHID